MHSGDLALLAVFALLVSNLAVGLTVGAGALWTFTGLSIGAIGLLGTVVAAADARRSSTRIKELVERGELAADRARENAAAAARTADQVRLLADDLGATSRAERLLAIRAALRYCLHRVFAAREVAAFGPVEPLDYDALIEMADRLMDPLSRAGRLVLPACKGFLQSLGENLEHLREGEAIRYWAADYEDHSPENLVLAQERVAALAQLSQRAIEEVTRPVDAIPLGPPGASVPVMDDWADPRATHPGVRLNNQPDLPDVDRPSRWGAANARATHRYRSDPGEEAEAQEARTCLATPPSSQAASRGRRSQGAPVDATLLDAD